MDWVSKDSALLAWLGIVVLIVGYVVAYDLWAHFSGHKTMTAGFQEALHDPVAGPFIAALWIGSFVGLCWHFLNNR